MLFSASTYHICYNSSADELSNSAMALTVILSVDVVPEHHAVLQYNAPASTCDFLICVTNHSDGGDAAIGRQHPGSTVVLQSSEQSMKEVGPVDLLAHNLSLHLLAFGAIQACMVDHHDQYAT